MIIRIVEMPDDITASFITVIIHELCKRRSAFPFTGNLDVNYFSESILAPTRSLI